MSKPNPLTHSLGVPSFHVLSKSLFTTSAFWYCFESATRQFDGPDGKDNCVIVGVPKESYPGERRVALVPAVIPTLAKAGLEVVAE